MTSSSTRFLAQRNEDSAVLGPDLPMAVFTSTEPWHPERIGRKLSLTALRRGRLERIELVPRERP